jgi:hypothetical protein
VRKTIGNFSYEWVQLQPAFPVYMHRHDGMIMLDKPKSTVSTDEYVIMQVIFSHFNLKYSFSSAL